MCTETESYGSQQKRAAVLYLRNPTCTKTPFFPVGRDVVTRATSNQVHPKRTGNVQNPYLLTLQEWVDRKTGLFTAYFRANRTDADFQKTNTQPENFNTQLHEKKMLHAWNSDV